MAGAAVAVAAVAMGHAAPEMGIEGWREVAWVVHSVSFAGCCRPYPRAGAGCLTPRASSPPGAGPVRELVSDIGGPVWAVRFGHTTVKSFGRVPVIFGEVGRLHDAH